MELVCVVLCVRAYVHVCVCMCVCMACICVRVCACTHTHVYVRVCVGVCAYVCVYVCTSLRVRACVCVHACLRVCGGTLLNQYIQYLTLLFNLLSPDTYFNIYFTVTVCISIYNSVCMCNDVLCMDIHIRR